MSHSATLSEYSIPASEALREIRSAEVDSVVTVPDWVQLSLHEQMAQSNSGLRVFPCANENQVLTVAAGLTIGGCRPLVMMQNQGLYNCINTLRAVCLDARIPMVLMVGQFGREYDKLAQPSTESKRSMVRLAEPLLQALGVPFHRLESRRDLHRIGSAFEQAQSESTAVVLLVGAPMAWC